MQVPLRISYHHCAPSDALNALIREKALELERFYPRITSCRVVVERPGYHHRHGKGAHFRVRIEVSVPGERSEERRVGKECRSRWSPYH